MRITYTPEDGSETRVWDFSPRRVRQSEAAIIERQYGKPYEQFVPEAQAGSARALRVLMWHLMRKDHPALRFEDVPDFFMDEIQLQHSVEELREAKSNIEKAGGLDPAEREVALALIESRIVLAEAEAAAEGDSSGK